MKATLHQINLVIACILQSAFVLLLSGLLAAMFGVCALCMGSNIFGAIVCGIVAISMAFVGLLAAYDGCRDIYFDDKLRQQKKRRMNQRREDAKGE